MSDEELMLAYQGGNPSALSFLLKRSLPKLTAIARGQMHSQHLADDALQEALISMARSAQNFHSDSKVMTWMYTIVKNACIDAARREKTRSGLNTSDDILLETVGEASDFTASKDAELVVEAAIRQLPDDQREALIFVYINGYSVEDAAELLGIAPGTVKSRCSRGKAALAEILKDLDPKQGTKASSRASKEVN
jgi:RNA polymerase sigma-70 factor (ECF subfamily)